MGEPPVLEEGWYLLSTAELERALLGAGAGSAAPDPETSSARRLTVAQALAYRDAGNLPDAEARSLRLVLHVADREDLETLQSKRLAYEPDFHDAPRWRRPGSRPVNVVPIRIAPIAPASGAPWWEQPELAELEQEWHDTGTVSGLRVPAAYRGFVFKTVLALRSADAEITADSVADSIARWLPDEAEAIRAALGGHPNEPGRP
ncbi:MAG: hypothetical protein ABR575_02430 [Actinomycetota bacterium]